MEIQLNKEMLSQNIDSFINSLYTHSKKSKKRTLLFQGLSSQTYGVSPGIIEKEYYDNGISTKSLREIAALKYLSSPFISQPLSVKLEKGRIITSFEQGELLLNWKKDSRYYPVIMYQLLHAIKHIFEKGFLCRDLSPITISVFDSYFYPRVKVTHLEQCRVFGGAPEGLTPPSFDIFFDDDEYIDRWMLCSIFYWLYTGMPLPMYEEPLRGLPIDNLLDDLLLRRIPYNQALEDPIFNNGYIHMLINDITERKQEELLIHEFPFKDEKLELLSEFFRIRKVYIDPYIVGNCVSLLSRINLDLSIFDIVDSVIQICVCLYTNEVLQQNSVIEMILKHLDYDIYQGSIPLLIHHSLTQDIFSFLLTMSLFEGEYTYQVITLLHDFCYYEKGETSYIRELLDTYSLYQNYYEEEYSECRKILYKIDGY